MSATAIPAKHVLPLRLQQIHVATAKTAKHVMPIQPTYIAQHAKPAPKTILRQDEADRRRVMQVHVVWICIGVTLSIVALYLQLSAVFAVAAPVAPSICQEIFDFIFRLN